MVPERRVEGDVLLASGLACATALIHVQAAVDHLDESWLYAVLFIALAIAQLAWGTALYRRPGGRRLLVSGIALSLGVVAVWVLSRTVGLPFGPDRAGPEAVGALDAIATFDELALAGVAVSMLWRASGRGLTCLRAVSLLSAFLSLLVLGGGFHAH